MAGSPVECEHAYWAYVARLKRTDITWYDFRKKFMELGGDGIYAAWKINYLEPAFQEMNFVGREKLIKLVGDYSYEKGICPVAEMLQPQLLQFKTNYFDTDLVDAQAEILKKTIAFFNK